MAAAAASGPASAASGSASVDARPGAVAPAAGAGPGGSWADQRVADGDRIAKTAIRDATRCTGHLLPRNGEFAARVARGTAMPRGSGCGGRRESRPAVRRSAATAHEAQLALHQLQILELVDQQCHPDERQPGPLDELVQTGRLPPECGEHLSLLVTWWRRSGDRRRRAERAAIVIGTATRRCLVRGIVVIGGATVPGVPGGRAVVHADL